MKRFIALSLLLTMLGACQNELSPEEVAKLYWSSVQNKDANGIKKFSTAFWDSETDELNSIVKIDSFELGQIRINEDTSEIDTTLQLTRSQAQSIQLITYLIQTEGRWKVDHNKTVSGIEPNTFNDVIEELTELGNLLKEEFHRSLDEMDETIPKIEKGISEFSKSLEKSIPELQQKLDDVVNKLQDLIDSLESQQQKSETTEI